MKRFLQRLKKETNHLICNKNTAFLVGFLVGYIFKAIKI